MIISFIRWLIWRTDALLNSYQISLPYGKKKQRRSRLIRATCKKHGLYKSYLTKGDPGWPRLRSAARVACRKGTDTPRQQRDAIRRQIYVTADGWIGEEYSAQVTVRAGWVWLGSCISGAVIQIQGFSSYVLCNVKRGCVFFFRMKSGSICYNSNSDGNF